jgi:Cation/multidrug efflux pump
LTYYIIVNPDFGRHNTEIARDISAKAEEMGMELSVQSSTMDISMLTGSGVTVDIYGNDLEVLQSIARDVAEMVSEIDGVCDVDNGLSESVPEMKITVDKDRAVDKGLTVAQVFQFVAQKLAEKTKITEADIDGKTMDIYMIDARNSDIRPRYGDGS